jgi:hypothetical protein
MLNQSEIDIVKSEILQKRNELCRCPFCNGNIADRQITLYAGLIRTVYEIYKYLGKNQKHEFNVKEVKALMSKNDYARFGDMVKFGGLIYKPKDESGKSHKGMFGMNMQRTKEFYRGERQIPVTIMLNQITNEILESNYVTVKDFPELHYQLTVDGEYNPKTVGQVKQDKLI